MNEESEKIPEQEETGEDISDDADIIEYKEESESATVKSWNRLMIQMTQRHFLIQEMLFLMEKYRRMGISFYHMRESFRKVPLTRKKLP